MSVQDNKREAILIEMFGLQEGDGNRIGVDAYSPTGLPVELKSTTKKSVSTARDLGRNHLAKWRNRYWIIGSFDITSETFRDIYMLAPIHLEEWFSKIEKKFDEADRLKTAVLTQISLPESDKKKVEYYMHRGSLLNDPNISLAYVRDNGVRVSGNPKRSFMEFIDGHPLENSMPTKIDMSEFFIFE